MPEPISPEGPKPITPKNVLPPTPEVGQNLKEPKRFSVTVDGEPRLYPETWQHAYIPDGPLAKLGGGLGSGSIPDKETQIKVLHEVTSPSQEIFAAYDRHDDTLAPEWFTKTLAPVMVDVGLSLERFRQPNQKSIGSDWAAAIDRMMDYDGYPKGIGEKAARAIGQLEGPTTTRSAFMRYLYRRDWQAFEKMLAFLLQEGTPDSFTLATYVAKDAFQEDENASTKAVPPDNKPKSSAIGHDAFAKLVNTDAYKNKTFPRENPYRIADFWQGIKPQEAKPAPGVSLYEKLADGSFTVDNLGRIVVKAPKVLTEEEAHKQLDQATKAARYAGVTQDKPTPHSRNIAREVFNYIIKEDYQPYSIRQLIRQLTPEQINQERGFFFTKDTNDWYRQTITPAMNRLLASDLYQAAHEFVPSGPTQEVTSIGLQRGIKGMLDTRFHPNFLGMVVDRLRAESPIPLEKISLRDIFRQFGQEPDLTHDSFEISLATIMAAGYEGTTIAKTLAEVAYGKIPDASRNDSRIPQQQDIPQAILSLLDIPFPISILEKASYNIVNSSMLANPISLGKLLGEMSYTYHPLQEDIAQNLANAGLVGRAVGEILLKDFQQQEVFLHQEIKVKQKLSVWDAKRQEIEGITDKLGRGLDEGIKETVVAFTMNGLNTTASCEGHLDHGDPTPWIDIGAPGEPHIRFNDEIAIFQQVADEHGISVEEMRRSQTEETRNAWNEAMQKSWENGETPEHQIWRDETRKQGLKVKALLDEFYANREVPLETRLYATQMTDEGGWTVMGGTIDDYYADRSARSPEETATLLLTRQAEMRAFTDFLRQKYLAQE